MSSLFLVEYPSVSGFSLRPCCGVLLLYWRPCYGVLLLLAPLLWHPWCYWRPCCGIPAVTGVSFHCWLPYFCWIPICFWHPCYYCRCRPCCSVPHIIAPIPGLPIVVEFPTAPGVPSNAVIHSVIQASQLWHPCRYWRGIPAVAGFSTVVEILRKEDHHKLSVNWRFQPGSNTYNTQRRKIKKREGGCPDCWEGGWGGLELVQMRRQLNKSWGLEVLAGHVCQREHLEEVVMFSPSPTLVQAAVSSTQTKKKD